MNRSIDTSDIGRILAVYFPAVEITAKDERLRLTNELIRFFSTPPGESLTSQVIISLSIPNRNPLGETCQLYFESIRRSRDFAFWMIVVL